MAVLQATGGYAEANDSHLGLTLVILVSMLGLARWSFEQEFLDYVNAPRKRGFVC